MHHIIYFKHKAKLKFNFKQAFSRSTSFHKNPNALNEHKINTSKYFRKQLGHKLPDLCCCIYQTSGLSVMFDE